MYFKQMQLKTGSGKYTVHLLGTITADGIIIELLGGEKPHVGAVVLTDLRPDSNEAVIKYNSTVVPRLGHKEDEVAKPIAEAIVKKLRQPVVLVAGIHVDDASRKEIKILVNNCWEAAQLFIKKYEQEP